MVGLCPFIFTPYFSTIKKNVYLLSEKRLKTGETAVQGVRDMDPIEISGDHILTHTLACNLIQVKFLQSR